VSTILGQNSFIKLTSLYVDALAGPGDITVIVSKVVEFGIYSSVIPTPTGSLLVAWLSPIASEQPLTASTMLLHTLTCYRLFHALPVSGGHTEMSLSPPRSMGTLLRLELQFPLPRPDML
jgi:hypothetical protein